MPKLFEFLQQYSDYIIIGLLLLMSVIMLATVIERFIFLSRVNVAKYSNIHALEIDLNRNMTIISTVGANAPYVGLLGTVIGILLTSACETELSYCSCRATYPFCIYSSLSGRRGLSFPFVKADFRKAS